MQMYCRRHISICIKIWKQHKSAEIVKLILKFIQKHEGPKVANRPNGSYHFLISKHKQSRQYDNGIDRYIDQWTGNVNAYIYGQLIFKKDVKKIQWERVFFSKSFIVLALTFVIYFELILTYVVKQESKLIFYMAIHFIKRQSWDPWET